MKRKRQNFLLVIAGIVLTLSLLTACASLERGVQADSDADTSSTLTIQDVWARSEDAGHNSAAYLQITNDADQDERLLGAESAIAVSTEIHDVVSRDNVMKMEEVDEISIPAGETVSLEPGGYHVMFFDLTEDLTVGEEIEFTLIFERAGEVTVTAEVREHTPGHGYGQSFSGQGGA
jgi:periplasmic copper chaperone A